MLLLNNCFVEMLSFSFAWTLQYIRGALENNARTRNKCSALPFYVSSSSVKRGGAAKFNSKFAFIGFKHFCTTGFHI
jgi:hypothetical protein